MPENDNDKSCPKCSSERWMTAIRAATFVYVVSAFENRDFFGGGAKGNSDLLANICADCGCTELYAADPEKVWKEWQKRKASG